MERNIIMLLDRRHARGSRSAEPLCARIKGANREVSEGKAVISDHGKMFSSYTRVNKERRTVKFCAAFFQGGAGL